VIYTAEFGMDRLIAVVMETIISDDRTLLNLERHFRNEKCAADGAFLELGSRIREIKNVVRENRSRTC
jgi:hypothetical protein